MSNKWEIMQLEEIKCLHVEVCIYHGSKSILHSFIKATA